MWDNVSKWSAFCSIAFGPQHAHGRVQSSSPLYSIWYNLPRTSRMHFTSFWYHFKIISIYFTCMLLYVTVIMFVQTQLAQLHPVAHVLCAASRCFSAMNCCQTESFSSSKAWRPRLDRSAAFSNSFFPSNHDHLLIFLRMSFLLVLFFP